MATPTATDANTGGSFNRYAYGNNSPYKFVDPDGRAVETPWDAMNVAMGIASLGANVAVGNYVGAAVDAVGLIADIAATATPGVPGGAATVIKASRSAGEVLAANKVAGAAGEAATRAKLGTSIAGEQVTMKASTGERARLDFVTTKSGVVETKTGGAALSKGQQAIKADIDAGRAVTPVGKNAADAGFTPGKRWCSLTLRSIGNERIWRTVSLY